LVHQAWWVCVVSSGSLDSLSMDIPTTCDVLRRQLLGMPLEPRCRSSLCRQETVTQGSSIADIV
jgi:hypothetical protein